MAIVFLLTQKKPQWVAALVMFEARCLKNNNAVLLPVSTTRDAWKLVRGALLLSHDVAAEFDHSISFALMSCFLLDKKLN